MNIKKNINISLWRTTSEEFALARAKREFAEADIKCAYREIVTIYLHSKYISDLFIANKYRVRKCTHEEWTEYFHTYLYPVERHPFFTDKIK